MQTVNNLQKDTTNYHLIFEQVFGIIMVSLPGCIVGNRGVHIMDYKTLIIEMLEKVNEQKLKIIYHYIKAFLGLGK